MRTFLCFIQIVLCSSCHNIFLMCKIMFEHLRKRQHLRLKASVHCYQTQHDHTKGILKLCMLVQLIQNYIGIGIFAKINTDTHALTAGVVIQVCDSIDFLVSYKLSDLFDQAGFIYKVWKFCNDNT